MAPYPLGHHDLTFWQPLGSESRIGECTISGDREREIFSFQKPVFKPASSYRKMKENEDGLRLFNLVKIGHSDMRENVSSTVEKTKLAKDMECFLKMENTDKNEIQS